LRVEHIAREKERERKIEKKRVTYWGDIQ
jgi:hypothetical protein